MDYAELDKLIACCREQLIQVIVTPATHGDISPFQKFAKYLKTRHRAGVALLADGRLLVLAPFERNDLRLRCVVVKAKPTAAASAALPSDVTARSLDGTESAHLPQTRYDCQADIALPPPEPEPRCEIRQHGRSRSSTNNCLQKQDITDNLYNGSPPGLKSNNQTNKSVVLLSSLPRIERATKIAQLRHEYEQFNENHYKILQEWSELNSN